MKLLTKELEKKIPPLYSQEHIKDPMVRVKFFYPAGRATWGVIEWDGTDRFFGWASIQEGELGYFSLSELQGFRGKFGLGIERDRYFKPVPLSEFKRQYPNPRDPNYQRGIPYGWVKVPEDFNTRAAAQQKLDSLRKLGYKTKIEKKTYESYSNWEVWYIMNPNPLPSTIKATPRSLQEWAQPGLVMYSPVTRETFSPPIGDIVGAPRRQKILDSTGKPLVLALKLPKRGLTMLNPLAIIPHWHWETKTSRVSGRLAWRDVPVSHSHEGGFRSHGHAKWRSHGRTKQSLINNEFSNPTSSNANPKGGKKISGFVVGDKATLRKDVLVRHARSVPAHLGYTREQFQWREVLGKREGEVGTITRIFPGGHINLRFKDGTVIGIEDSELVKYPAGPPSRKNPLNSWRKLPSVRYGGKTYFYVRLGNIKTTVMWDRETRTWGISYGEKLHATGYKTAAKAMAVA